MTGEINACSDAQAHLHLHRLRQETLARVVAPASSRDETRALLRAEGLAACAAAIALYAVLGGSWWLFALLFFAPDLAMLGYAGGARLGAFLYNAAHSTLGPAALGLAGLAVDPQLIAFAAIWAAHVGFDRALGYGLKRATGFRDTHLGRIGRDPAPAR